MKSSQKRKQGMEISHAYDDILDLERPVSRTHRPMPLGDRAAQFSPFAALTGYEDAITETARLTETRIELTEAQKEQLDYTLQQIRMCLSEQPEVTVTWFVPDADKEGGRYETRTGHLKKLDDYKQELVFAEGFRVSVADLTELSDQNPCSMRNAEQ